MASIPITITEQVSEARNLEISYKTLHPSAKLENTASNTEVIFPYSSIISKYKDFLFNIIITIELTEKEQEKYQFKPKMFSQDLYGTTELWDTILILNECVFTSQFKPKSAKVYDPNLFKRYINEIMILEEEIVK